MSYHPFMHQTTISGTVDHTAFFQGERKRRLDRNKITDQGSVQQSRLSSQFALQCCNLLHLLNTKKNIPFHLNLNFNLQF